MVDDAIIEGRRKVFYFMLILNVRLRVVNVITGFVRLRL